MPVDIKHTGTPRHSGRYPWGSGGEPYQHNEGLLGRIKDLRNKGLSDVEIAKSEGLNTRQLREQITIERNKQEAAESAMAYRLKEKGYSDVAIGKKLGISDKTVAARLNSSRILKNKVLEQTAAVLKADLDKYGYIDVGMGVEQHLGIKDTQKKAAVALLKEQGYLVHKFSQEQMGTGKYTNMVVLYRPDVTKQEIYKNRDNIKIPNHVSDDGGETYRPNKEPEYIDSKRVYINHDSQKDGLIELRRGVDDISLGNSRYAQVRIGVDGNKYMKGMAMYNDDIPDGYDIVYNTNKKPGEKVFKDIETKDPDYPFGAVLKEKLYIDKDGKQKSSFINTVGMKEGSGEEGSWNEWSRNLSSQILSKQNPELAKRQLKLAYDLKKEEYDEIMSLTNPAVKQALLKPFADSCDAATVHLKAAPLPGQRTQVILPLLSLKPKEIYAQNFNDGDNVVLIRHPHGGIFEIPEVIVNNKNPEGKRLLGKSKDAIGIHPKVASILSGADFDGDTVIVIPNKKGHISKSDPIESLKDFKPREAYPYYDGMKVMTKRQKGIKMGDVSNLITDMTIKGANRDEIAKAVRHSMVVIDAEKHKLNYQQSYIDNGIAALKKKWQGKETAGASTLISRAKAEERVNQRRELRPKKGSDITGDKIYEDTGRTYFRRRFKKDPVTGEKIYIDGEGTRVPKQFKSKKMLEVDDAFKLSSGTRIEKVYAEHANSLKDLARKARISYNNTKNLEYSESANKVYKSEVNSLKSKLNLAHYNKPLERKAQLIAGKRVAAKIKSNPDIEEKDLKRIKGKELINARNRIGAGKHEVKITDREWDAIQAGAVSHHLVLDIILNANQKAVKQRALPRTTTGLSSAKVSRAKMMFDRGYTRAEIASALGISVNVLDKAGI